MRKQLWLGLIATTVCFANVAAAQSRRAAMERMMDVCGAPQRCGQGLPDCPPNCVCNPLAQPLSCTTANQQ